MGPFWRRYPWLLRAAALLLVALATLLLQRSYPLALERVDQLGSDLGWRVGATTAPERRVVVVDIDEASLRQIGPWPWSRQTLATLSDRLRESGVALQVYDLFLPEARDGDEALAAAWARSAVVSGQLFSLDSTVTPAVGNVSGALTAPSCPEFAPATHGHYGNAAAVLQGRPVLGHITPRIEGDGVVRRVPALVCHEGRAYPSLALAALWRLAQAPGATVSAQDWTWSALPATGLGAVAPLAPAAWLSSASLPGLVVPVDAHGDMVVPYRWQRSALASVSAAEVLRGGAGTDLLRGAVVLVGATAIGIGDTVATPLTAVAGGLEVHAQSMLGLLDHRVPSVPRNAGWLQFAACAAVALALLVLVRQGSGVPAKRLPLVGIGLTVGVAVAAMAAQLQAELMLPWSLVAVFTLLAAMTLAAVEHAITRMQRERLSAHLGAYLPEPVARRLMASEPSGVVQVHQRNISVLMADIRNFSAFALHKPPEETAALLHAFSCIAVDVVEQHGGVVENVAGDSVLAVWNAYSDCADHPAQALAAAKELLRATRNLLAPTQMPHEQSPLQPLALGLGLETGAAVVGSFGPARRRAHAALGEPVSVAARLQAMTADLSFPLLIGPQMAAQLPAAETESVGEYLLEGMGRLYAIRTAAAWAELVPTEPMWARAAAADRSAESTVWPDRADDSALAAVGARKLRTLGDA